MPVQWHKSAGLPFPNFGVCLFAHLVVIWQGNLWSNKLTRGNTAMKISDTESGRAAANLGAAEAKILPKDRPRGLISSKPDKAKQLSPLERGMLVAEAALAGVPDVREDLVSDLKKRIEKGNYKITGDEIAEMMLRRLAADRIR
jgi:anti-sigma28 factor (negative regulator of flagellin synthesis)